MTIDGEVTSRCIVMRRLDTRDVVSFADAGNFLRHVGPGRAAVTTYLNIPVIGPRPKYAGNLGRFSYRYNIAVAGVAIMLGGHRILAGHSHNRQRVAIDVFREIDRRGPGVATVHGPEEPVSTHIQNSRVVW